LTPSGRPASYLGVTLFGGIFGLFHCGLWALAFVYPAAVEDRRLRAAEADKLRLEAEALRTTAELSRLRSQLEPHFLLNTLNAIAGLVTQDPREARRLLACLGELLGDTLQADGDTQTLGRQVAWLKGYASILESRFTGSLRFEWDVAANVQQVLLPRLLLQPLLENAVTHGALKGGGPGLVRLTARREVRDGTPVLVCTVEDDGPGFDPAVTREGGIGLPAARRRLALWSPDARFDIRSSGDGTRVVVELPWKA
jgi:LytS/YehU family sensor histidine kinase